MKRRFSKAGEGYSSDFTTLTQQKGEGGIAHGTPSDCNNSISDQQACDNNCKGATCSFKCIKTKSYGDKCGTYKCSNGMHCDNAQGSGTMLRCVRK